MRTRFCDILLRNPHVTQDFKEELKKAVIVEATNVSDFYFSDPQEHWHFKDFPCTVPPFPLCWLDFTAPPIVSEEHGEIPWRRMNGGNAPEQWGFLCLSQKLAPEERLLYLQSTIWKKYPELYFPHLGSLFWGVQLLLFFPEKGPEYLYWYFSYFLDEDGNIVMINEEDSLSLSVIMDPKLHDYLDRIEKLHGYEAMEKFKVQMYDGVCPFWHTALLAFSFMNCKNIELTEIFPEKVIPHNKAQKRRGEKPFQPLAYKVLNISPLRKSSETIGAREAVVRAKMRGHFVRGHFATYTEEHKLFGKYTGRFYRPMHRRGSTGNIEKDYKIAPVQRPQVPE
jgi:hypothetical protein